MVAATSRSPVGIVGLAFKPGTDDLRESPAVELVQRLLAKKKELIIFDEDVYAATLTGTNKQFIETQLPQLAELLISDPESFSQKAGALVFTHASPRLRTLIRPRDDATPIIDLAGLFSAPPENGNYEGSGW
jgi:GDP-mannose 6-dehydrogenase